MNKKRLRIKKNMDYISHYFPYEFRLEKIMLMNYQTPVVHRKKNVHNNFENGYRIQTKLDK